MTVKKYLVYWVARDGFQGNTILTFNPKKIVLMEIIDYLVKSANELDPSAKIKSLSIKFMMELK